MVYGKSTNIFKIIEEVGNGISRAVFFVKWSFAHKFVFRVFHFLDMFLVKVLVENLEECIFGHVV